jgi:hypothetical protein
MKRRLHSITGFGLQLEKRLQPFFKPVHNEDGLAEVVPVKGDLYYVGSTETPDGKIIFSFALVIVDDEGVEEVRMYLLPEDHGVDRLVSA